jgi:hypothetical protein
MIYSYMANGALLWLRNARVQASQGARGVRRSLDVELCRWVVLKLDGAAQRPNSCTAMERGADSALDFWNLGIHTVFLT